MEKESYKLGLDDGEYFHVMEDVTIDENITDEVDSQDVNLSSFKLNKELNPKIWKGEKLNPKVRLRLLDIADEFWDDLDISWVSPKDILLTGSISNYNWSKYSDIDLHILVDFNKVDEKVDFVKEFFDSKKKIWNDVHETLKIYGFNVEIYVQDIKEEHTSSGVYSVDKDKWLIKPNKDEFSSIGLNKYSIKEKSSKYMTKIDSLFDEFEETSDMYEIEEISKKVKILYDRIKALRKDGLGKDGEMSDGNVIFKVLRRSGYLEKLIDLKALTYDKIMSL